MVFLTRGWICTELSRVRKCRSKAWLYNPPNARPCTMRRGNWGDAGHGIIPLMPGFSGRPWGPFYNTTCRDRAKLPCAHCTLWSWLFSTVHIPHCGAGYQTFAPQPFQLDRWKVYFCLQIVHFSQARRASKELTVVKLLLFKRSESTRSIARFLRHECDKDGANPYY